jgi:hypothetical protein
MQKFVCPTAVLSKLYCREWIFIHFFYMFSQGQICLLILEKYITLLYMDMGGSNIIHIHRRYK